MLGGNGHTCGPCPKCGANDLWNNTSCMTCGYINEEPDEDEEE